VKARPDQVWRTSRAFRVTLAVIVVAFLAFIAIATAGDASSVGPACVAAALVTVYTWAVAFRPYVEMTADAVVVQNPVRRRTIPLASIADVGLHRKAVLTIWTTDGRSVRAFAVQNGVVALLLRRRGRGDEVATAIRHRARHHSTHVVR
jgi:hypothetical protein